MNNFRRRPWLFAFIPLAAIALFGGVVMLLWNAIIPGITGWALLTYWKAVGLLVLSKILFSGFPGRGCGHGGPPWARHARTRQAWWEGLSDEERAQWNDRKEQWRGKWMAMSEEERAKVKAGWKERCGAWRGGTEK
jgi:hypothetical protein